jgi:hypothetical protein
LLREHFFIFSSLLFKFCLFFTKKERKYCTLNMIQITREIIPLNDNFEIESSISLHSLSLSTRRFIDRLNKCRLFILRFWAFLKRHANIFVFILKVYRFMLDVFHYIYLFFFFVFIGVSGFYSLKLLIKVMALLGTLCKKIFEFISKKKTINGHQINNLQTNNQNLNQNVISTDQRIRK